MMEGDIAHVWLKGKLNIREARLLLSLAEREIGTLKGFFLLLDMQHSGDPPEAEARHVLVEWTRKHPPIGAAVVGGNSLMRALITLAAKATATFSNRAAPPRFFATEAQALSWFEQLRAEGLSGE